MLAHSTGKISAFEGVLEMALGIAVEEGDNELMCRLLLLGGLADVDRGNAKGALDMYALAEQTWMMLPHVWKQEQGWRRRWVMRRTSVSHWESWWRCLQVLGRKNARWGYVSTFGFGVGFLNTLAASLETLSQALEDEAQFEHAVSSCRAALLMAPGSVATMSVLEKVARASSIEQLPSDASARRADRGSVPQ